MCDNKKRFDCCCCLKIKANVMLLPVLFIKLFVKPYNKKKKLVPSKRLSESFVLIANYNIKGVLNACSHGDTIKTESWMEFRILDVHCRPLNLFSLYVKKMRGLLHVLLFSSSAMPQGFFYYTVGAWLSSKWEAADAFNLRLFGVQYRDSMTVSRE